MEEKLTLSGSLVSYKPLLVRATPLSTFVAPLTTYDNFIKRTPIKKATVTPTEEPITTTFSWQYNSIPGMVSGGYRNILFNGRVRNLEDVLGTLLSNIDVLNYRQTGEGKHTCTRAVVHALTGQRNYNIPSGVANPEALYNLLSGQGWQDVLNDSYSPQPGDVYTVWGIPGLYGMHSSMYTGSNWASYTNEDVIPYFWNKRNQPGVKMHVMRYISSSKKGGVIHGISRLIGIV